MGSQEFDLGIAGRVTQSWELDQATGRGDQHWQGTWRGQTLNIDETYWFHSMETYRAAAKKCGREMQFYSLQTHDYRLTGSDESVIAIMK